MGVFNINALTPKQIEKLLPAVDGITTPMARKLGAYYRKRGFIADKAELLGKLKTFGLAARYVKGVDDIVDVRPKGVPPFEVFFNDVEIDFEEEIKEEDPPIDEDIIIGGPPPANNRPLVFVPGIMGSELYVVENQGTPKEFRKKKWPPGPPVGILGADSFRDLEDPIREDRLVAGSNTTLDAYTTLLENLERIGYKANENLLVYTYNWTQSNERSGARLARAIDAFLADFNRRYGTAFDAVDVICHSMGGLVTRSAILKSGASVSKTVYIASPHYGAPNSYFVLHPGIGITGFFTELVFDLFKFFKDREDFDDIDEALNTLGALCPSVYELLPNRFYVENVPMLAIDRSPLTDDFFTKTTTETYFRNQWQFPVGFRRMVQDGLNFSESLGSQIPGEHLLIISTSVDTLDQVEFEFDAFTADSFEEPEASVRQGDGTVPSFSARAGLSNSQIRLVNGVDHLAIPNEQRTFRIIRSYLNI